MVRGLTPSFSWPRFTIANGGVTFEGCPLTFSVHEDSGGSTTVPAGLSGTVVYDSATDSFSVETLFPSTKATYNFYLKVTSSGGETFIMGPLEL